MMEISIVYDNRALREDVLADWGFACVITHEEATILFDTGTHPKILLRNMDVMGFAPSDMDRVVISHEHYDHIGGLGPIVRENSGIDVIVPADFSEEFKQQVTSDGGNVVDVRSAGEITPGVATTGPVGDTIIEQALTVSTARGTIVLTGCAHPGIVQMVRAAKDFCSDPIYLVLGGFHLKDIGVQEVREVIEELQHAEVQKTAPCHCTGDSAIEQFAEAFGEHFVRVGAGWKGSF